MDIDLKQIRELLAVVGSTDITELTIEAGDQRITVKKSPPVVVGAAQTLTAELPVAVASAATVPVAQQKAAPAQQLSFEPKAPAKAATPSNNDEPGHNNGFVQITSPMVGTFYRSPSPTAPAFVNVGDHVKVGQTVCIIEAMKLMNDMPSEVSGKIVKICVDNGTTVEYGQALFLVDPKG